MVAYETTLVLLSRGVNVKGILLIDAPSPLHYVHLSAQLISNILQPADTHVPTNLTMDMHFQFVTNSDLLKRYQANEVARKGFPPAVYLRCRDPVVLEGVSDVPAWISERSEPRAQLADWEELLAQDIKTIEVPGNHFEPFQKQNVCCIDSFPLHHQ